VQYLHEKDVVHRDISTRNLLVSEKFEIVVADFGMSQLKQTHWKNEQHENDNHPIEVPVRWLAPECIMDDDYSRESDVYAFGITLFELFAEKRPYDTLPTRKVAALVVHKRQRPDVESAPGITRVPGLVSLMTKCWDGSPKNRPTFEEIIESLTRIMNKFEPLIEIKE